MSGKASLFYEIKEKCNNSIILGDKGKCKILGIDKVGKDSSKFLEDFYFVEFICKILGISKVCNLTC